MEAETATKQVALGGTFDPIHDGHRALFAAAFEHGDVTVGLTCDGLARNIRPIERPVRPYVERRLDLAHELRRFAEHSDRSFMIHTLHAPTGIADAPKFDVLVVSPETAPAGERINRIRVKRGIPPLEIDVVDHVLADDGKIISSTRILQGEIDENGTVLE